MELDCSELGCEAKIEFTHVQGIPVVNCPKYEGEGDIFLQGMNREETDVDCPLIDRIVGEDIKP